MVAQKFPQPISPVSLPAPCKIHAVTCKNPLPCKAQHDGMPVAIGTRSYQQNYTGANVTQYVIERINDFKPTIVYVTAPLDTDTDHKGTSYFVISALASLGQLGIMRNYIIHGGNYSVPEITEYPIPRGLHTDMALIPPPIALEYNWSKATLNAHDINIKTAAVSSHCSQMEIMEGYMQSFIRRNELYAVLNAAQMTLPAQSMNAASKPK